MTEAHPDPLATHETHELPLPDEQPAPPEVPVFEMLSVGLAGSLYAMPVARVRQIVRVRPLTRIPRTPAWMSGALALRGEVVEVVDLRILLAATVTPATRRSRIVILQGEADERTVGMLVDSVDQVLRIPEDEIELLDEGERESVWGIGRHAGRFVSMLDVDRVVEGADA